MPTRLTGHPSLPYLGVEAPQPPNIVAIRRAPTVNDYLTFNTGDMWIDISGLSLTPPVAPAAKNIWMLVSKNKQIANATWVNFAGGTIVTLEGNVGGPVPPDGAGNIHTIGDAVGITVVGNPGTNTLTWSLVGGGVATQSYLTDDAQVEVPNAAGQLSVFGGATAPNNAININTRRGANVNTVAIDLNNSIRQPFTSADASQGVYALGPTSLAVDYFMHAYGTRNAFLGRQAGNMTLTVANATDNTCIGAGAGFALIGAGALQGSQNTFVGSSAGADATNSSNNTFVGSLCGAATTTSGNNVGLGTTSLRIATTGTGQNTAVGFGSGSALLTGANNCLFGFNSGSNYTGAESNNICIGDTATGKVGESGTIRIKATGAGGTQNIFIGNDSGNNTYTTANNCIGIGVFSMSNLTTAVHSVGVGDSSLQSLTTGDHSTAIGEISLQLLTTGLRNTAVAAGSASLLATGSDNCYFGYITGGAHVGAESDNIIIGANVPGVAAETNALHIGAATGGAAGIGQLNKAFICGIRGIVTGVNDAIPVLVDSANQLGTVSSSERYKDNIEDMDTYSEDILSLRCVTFNFKNHSPEVVSVGLIAEEVEEIMPQLVVKDKEGRPETVRYLDLIPMLLNEVQKLEKRVRELESKGG